MARKFTGGSNKLSEYQSPRARRYSPEGDNQWPVDNNSGGESEASINVKSQMHANVWKRAPTKE